MNVSSKPPFGWAPWAGAALALAVSGHAAAAPTNEECEARANDTPARLVACIQQAALYAHLVAFQQISDRNPGPDGHGNRDTGQPGYEASVDYVAGLMRRAGYRVTVQPYDFTAFSVTGSPAFSAAGRDYRLGEDWYVARLSGHGAVTAPVRPVGAIATGAGGASGGGCSPADFTGFPLGDIALIQRGGCDLDAKVANAQAAAAAGVIVFNYDGSPDRPGGKAPPRPAVAYPAYLQEAASIPVVGVASYAVGAGLYRRYVEGGAPVARLDVQTRIEPKKVDYNLIADSPFGDPDQVVVVEAHLDSIFGAGILDNASGSATILEVALKLARTPTRNHLRFIWFGGEEIGLLGSKYYTHNLAPAELRRIVFDLDSDVTATPNYAILVADPQFADGVARFPPNVVPASRRGNRYFFDYFRARGFPIQSAPFGNDGTDSKSFALAGVPDSGILTQQDCCKSKKEVAVWGGFRGNYEGAIPSFNGGCVDRPHRWCDNLSNNSAYVLEFISKGFAYATFKLANDASLAAGGK
ncbi:MAG: M28 family peptidase [Caulobacteraceae bacterium]|nr:M28 family peptidase [Caulobacteraceae bacterium]